MDAILDYAFANGAINTYIISIALIWAMWFITHHYWPYRMEHCKKEQDIKKVLREKEIDTEAEIKKLEIQRQIDIYNKVTTNLDGINASITGLQAVFNDFLQNILKQFIEDRKDLVDSGLLKGGE